MSLRDETQTFQQSWEARVGDAIARQFETDIEALRGSGILDHSAKAGDRFPATSNLRDAHNAPFDLSMLMGKRPTVVTFYRGGWCPYCNLELKAYQSLIPEIEAHGAALVAISPELPDHSLSTAEKNGLSFAVLSDVGGKLASALGIRFTLSEAVLPYYEKAGHALPERNGDGEWALPMPATFVVDKGGLIAAAFIEPDYRKRLEPRDVLQVLSSLAKPLPVS
ncbi:MAG: AhpC/TSA family protein [Beijerinckiaceae bacterium]|nr:AhpC/TSA family protein [Beijerinckiaceae bacterium]